MLELAVNGLSKPFRQAERLGDGVLFCASLQEEFPLHDLLRRAADGKKDQHAAKKRQRDQRVHKPHREAGNVKGDMDQKFEQRHKRTQRDARAANDIQSAAAQVFEQNDHRCGNEADAGRYRKGKAQKPASSGHKVDVQQIQPNGCKTAGYEDYRVRPAEPERQHKQNIADEQRSGDKSRPGDAGMELQVDHQRNQQRHDKEGRHHDLAHARMYLRRRGAVAGIQRQRIFPENIGMDGLGAAERAAPLRICKFDATINTIHDFLSFKLV